MAKEAEQRVLRKFCLWVIPLLQQVKKTEGIYMATLNYTQYKLISTSM